ncbi:hypothetical protein ACFPRL_23775 [Pseudoclavibacter helvolus]
MDRARAGEHRCAAHLQPADLGRGCSGRLLAPHLARRHAPQALGRLHCLDSAATSCADR